jgi:hypothetical protein
MQEDQPTKPGPAERDGLKYPEWQLPLQELILEFDRATLHQKMQRVEALIYDRVQQLQEGSDGHTAEREALNDAISLLRVIKRDKLDFPDWK